MRHAAEPAHLHRRHVHAAGRHALQRQRRSDRHQRRRPLQRLRLPEPRIRRRPGAVRRGRRLSRRLGRLSRIRADAGRGADRRPGDRTTTTRSALSARPIGWPATPGPRSICISAQRLALARRPIVRSMQVRARRKSRTCLRASLAGLRGDWEGWNWEIGAALFDGRDRGQGEPRLEHAVPAGARAFDAGRLQSVQRRLHRRSLRRATARRARSTRSGPSPCRSTAATARRSPRGTSSCRGRTSSRCGPAMSAPPSASKRAARPSWTTAIRARTARSCFTDIDQRA